MKVNLLLIGIKKNKLTNILIFKYYLVIYNANLW